MAKKSRRARAKNRVGEPAQRPNLPVSQPKATAAAPSRSSARAAAMAPAAVIQPANYDYVKSDLVRIGIIAGALILIIVILTFIPALRA